MDRRSAVALASVWTLAAVLVLLAAMPTIARTSVRPPVDLEAQLIHEGSAIGDQARAYDAQIAELRWQHAQQLEKLRKERDELTRSLREQQRQLRDTRKQLAAAEASAESLF